MSWVTAGKCPWKTACSWLTDFLDPKVRQAKECWCTLLSGFQGWSSLHSTATCSIPWTNNVGWLRRSKWSSEIYAIGLWTKLSRTPPPHPLYRGWRATWTQGMKRACHIHLYSPKLTSARSFGLNGKQPHPFCQLGKELLRTLSAVSWESMKFHIRNIQIQGMLTSSFRVLLHHRHPRLLSHSYRAQGSFQFFLPLHSWWWIQRWKGYHLGI